MGIKNGGRGFAIYEAISPEVSESHRLQIRAVSLRLRNAFLAFLGSSKQGGIVFMNIAQGVNHREKNTMLVMVFLASGGFHEVDMFEGDRARIGMDYPLPRGGGQLKHPFLIAIRISELFAQEFQVINGFIVPHRVINRYRHKDILLLRGFTLSTRGKSRASRVRESIEAENFVFSDQMGAVSQMEIPIALCRKEAESRLRQRVEILFFLFGQFGI